MEEEHIMKKISLSILLSLILCTSVQALIYTYTITTSSKKIRMEVEHSRKKETILFDFSQIPIWQKTIEDKEPVFVDEFNRLINILNKSKCIGLKKYEPSLINRSDKQITEVYISLKRINEILKKIDASVIIEEKYSLSVQLKNILRDPTIYLPQGMGGAAHVYAKSQRKQRSFLFRNKPYIDYSLSFLSDSCLSFYRYPSSIIASIIIAYIRHQ